jgi:hypothetical protein
MFSKLMFLSPPAGCPLSFWASFWEWRTTGLISMRKPELSHLITYGLMDNLFMFYGYKQMARFGAILKKH